MYCQFCEEEQSPRSKFCKVCGAKLLERPPEKIAADLAKYRFLLAEVQRWAETGRLVSGLADDLLLPYRRRLEVLEVALAVARGGPIPEPVKAPVALETKPALPPAPSQTAGGGSALLEASMVGAHDSVTHLVVAAPVAPAALEIKPAVEVLAEPTNPIDGTKPLQSPAPTPAAPAPVAVAAAVPGTVPQPSGGLPPLHAPRNEVAQAAAASAAALASAAVEPMDFPDAPPTPEQEIIERESTWSKIWKPFLSETVLWFTGPFLLLAGALFFAKESTGVVQALIVTGILALYAGIFWFVGRRLVKKPNLVVAGRILTGLSVALAPLSLLALGWGEMRTGAPWLFMATSVVIFLGMVALVWAAGATFSETGRTHFTGYASFLLFLFAAVPFVDGAAWLAALDAAALFALWFYAPAIAEVKSDKGHAGFLGGGIAWFALVLFVRVHYQGHADGFGRVEYGPLFAMLVAVVLRAEKKLLDYQGGPSWIALLAYASLIVPPVCVFATEARRFGPSFGITCLILTVLLVQGALRWKSRTFLTISLVVGWFSFYTLTGLFKLSWLLAFLGGFKSMTGYAPNQKLPLNYYFLASLIYVAGLAWAYATAKKANATWATGVIRNFTLAGAIFLMFWGHLGTDFKPAFFTAAIVFAAALALSHWLNHWRLAYLSAAALVVAGFDLGLVLDLHSAAPTVMGLAGASLAAIGISIVLSVERARAFRDLAMLAFFGAVMLVPFSETGWTATSAWALTGIAGVAAAFAVGTGVPAAVGLMALAGAALQASHALHVSDAALGWIAYGITFALLAGSGIEKVPAKAPTDRGVWFGQRLPLAAEGYAILRGPMAFAALFTAITALVTLIAESHSDAPALAFAVFALTQLWLARRQPSVTFLTFALLTGTVAAIMAVANRFHETPTLGFATAAACGLACAALAVAIDRLEPFQKLLRIPSKRAGWTFVVHACLFVGSAGILAMSIQLDHSGNELEAWPTLAIGAAAFLLLPRFNRWSGWLYPFQAFASAAVALLVPTGWVPFVVACFAFLPLALALVAKRDPDAGSLLSGVDLKQLAEPIGILALLQALAGAIACFAVGADEMAPLASLAPATAALALFFAIFPRLEGGSVWLSLSGFAAWVTVAVLLPFELTALSLAAFSTILVGIGALLALRWTKHGRVLAMTGLGMAACAIAAFWYGWPAASVARAETLFALVSLTLVIAPRVLSSAVFLPMAVATGAISLALAAPSADRSLWLAVLATGVGGVALSLRRFPKLSAVLFGLESHFGALSLLAISAPVLSLVAVGLGSWGGQQLVLAGALGLAAATLLLSFLAIEEPWLAAGAGVLGVAALATLDVRPELAFLLAQAGVNALFLTAGALAWSPTRGLLDRTYDLFSPPRGPRGIPKPTEDALSTTASLLAFLGLLVLCFMSIWRIFAFGPLGVFESAWAPWMAGAQVVTALHQLRRRPMLASWHGLLVAILAALWLLFSMPVWNYVAGVWALSLVLLAWATRSPRGRRVVDSLSPGFSDAQVENLRRTLSAYATATAFLGLQALHPEKLESPVSWALLTATFALQALLGSGFGRAMFLLALPFAVHYAAFFVGIKLDTGRPQEVILPYVAAAMAVVALLSERIGVWRKNRGHGGSGIVAAHLYGMLAACEWAASLLVVRYAHAEVGACFVAGASLTLLWTLRALAADSKLFAWAAELSFLAVYFSLRMQTDWLGPRGMRGDKDSIATLLLGVLFVGLHTAVKKLKVPAFRQPSRFAALALPVLSALLMAREASYGNAVLLLGVAMQLTVLSWVEGRGKLSGILAAVAFNLALAMVWLTKGIGGGADAQYYVIPAGFTLIVLTYLYGESLGPAWKARLRSVGMLAIYLSSAIPALTFESPGYLWTAIGLCVLGIVAGIAFRVRAYLYLGTGFMVASLVTNMTRYGLRDHRVGAAFLTGLGLVIIVAMVFFTSRREELLGRYRKYRQLMAAWE